MSNNSILLPYQNTFLRAVDSFDVVVVEKSRRIGFTWCASYLAVMYAKNKMTVYYLGYNQDMTREFIDACAGWAKALNILADAEIFLDENDKDAIQNFRMKVKEGREIITLTSKARNLRGKQGLIIIDEAAFHDDFDTVLAAALPLLIWGGKIVVLSTHLGVTNSFNLLCEDIRAGRFHYHLMRTTFQNAITDGLFKVICQKKEMERQEAIKRGDMRDNPAEKVVWTTEAEQEFIRNIRSKQKAPEQELDCIPSKSAGVYLPLILLESRATNTAKVYRWKEGEDFMTYPPEIRSAVAFKKAEDALYGVTFDDYQRFGLGVDVGRHHDLTVLWVFGVTKSLKRVTVLVIELSNIPHDQQRNMCVYVIRKIPKSKKIATDRTGMGDYLAEAMISEFGANSAEGISLSKNWYATNFPRMKGGLEAELLDLPQDENLLSDLSQIALIDGLPSIPKQTNQKERHADGAVACLLAWWACDQDVWEVSHYASESTQKESESLNEF